MASCALSFLFYLIIFILYFYFNSYEMYTVNNKTEKNLFRKKRIVNYFFREQSALKYLLEKIPLPF